MVSSQVFEICSKSESLPTWKAYPKSQLIFNFAMLQEDTLSIQCQDMDSAQLIDEFSIFGPHHLDLIQGANSHGCILNSVLLLLLLLFKFMQTSDHARQKRNFT